MTLSFKTFDNINTSRCNRWHSVKSWSLSDWMTALMGEVGEAADIIDQLRDRDEERILSDFMTSTTAHLGKAANIIKKLNRYRDGIVGNNKPEDTEANLKIELAKELAKAARELLMTAQASGVDINRVWLDDEDRKDLLNRANYNRLELKGKLAEELADITHYLFLTSRAADINLEEVTIDKFNEVSEKNNFPERLTKEGEANADLD